MAGEIGMSAGRSAERRHGDGDGVEAVEQVLSEFGLVEGLVGGGDDADIDGNGLGAADAVEGAGFDGAEDARLVVEGKIADFIQKEGAAVGLFSKRPRRCWVAPVKAPFSWPKNSLSKR